jgi:1-acyl-sn-glycerol-3-phosphate acyltransferase
MKDDSLLLRATQLSWLLAVCSWYGLLRRLGNSIDRRDGVLEQRIAVLMCRRILERFDLRIDVEGVERLGRLDRRYCIVSNHLSYLDWVIYFGAFPIAPAFIAKKEVTWYPVIGPYLRSRGVLIDRRSGLGARRAIADAAAAEAPWPILLFPEGTRSPDGEIKRFKRGGVHAISEARMPIVPVTILGSHEAFPRGARTIRPHRRIRLVIGDPVDPGAFADSAALVDELHARIRAVYEARRHEVLAG